jgi:hypothetical protein
MTAQEGRGLNSYAPMPFIGAARVEYTNSSDRPVALYYQIDYTLGPVDPSYLHVTFRRDNPTVQGQDFVIASGLDGPGRFLGCNVGVRVIDGGLWYGEGEVKIYRDGDTTLPTICGTGLEDYVGSAWGLGPHCAPYAGAPLVVGPRSSAGQPGHQVDLVGFYRWHVPDPIMFQRDLKVTIQQIGAVVFEQGQREQMAGFAASNPLAGGGWRRVPSLGLVWGIAERIDDYCATAYVYCREPQSVPRLDVGTALANIERREYEQAGTLEGMAAITIATPDS